MNDEELASRVGAALGAPDALDDPRWEQLAAGGLDADGTDALRDAAGDAAVDAHRPLDPAPFEAMLAPAAEAPNRLLYPVALAAAAAVLLLVVWPSQEPPYAPAPAGHQPVSLATPDVAAALPAAAVKPDAATRVPVARAPRTSPPPRRMRVDATTAEPTAPTAPKPATDDEWRGLLQTSHILAGLEVTRLRAVPRSDRDYRDVHRRLADHYYRTGDPPRHAAALEVGYRHDPRLLFSLAGAHAAQRRYARALATMRRAAPRLDRLPAAERAQALRMHGEVAELAYAQQNERTPGRADTDLLDQAMNAWRRYRTFSQGNNPAAVRAADRRIDALETLRTHGGR